MEVLRNHSFWQVEHVTKNKLIVIILTLHKECNNIRYKHFGHWKEMEHVTSCQIINFPFLVNFDIFLTEYANQQCSVMSDSWTQERTNKHLHPFQQRKMVWICTWFIYWPLPLWSVHCSQYYNGSLHSISTVSILLF